MKTSDISDEQVVAACCAWRAEGGLSSLDRLVAATGAPVKVAVSAMERADGRGLVDYGVSLRFAWPS